MKSAHQILTQTKFYPSAQSREWYPVVIMAMEQYADQFRLPVYTKQKEDDDLKSLILRHFKPTKNTEGLELTNGQIIIHIEQSDKIRITNRNQVGKIMVSLGFKRTRTATGRYYLCHCMSPVTDK